MSPLKVTIIIALGTSLSIHAAQPQTATWQKADGPYGGPVGPVAVDTNDYIFAATNGVGIHRSTDNGSTWSLMNNGLTNMSISSLGVSSISILFAGTGGGIFLTTNRGETWRPSNLGLSSLSIGPMAFDSSNRIYAATGSGVYISSDSGNSWSQTGFTSSDVRSVATNSSGHIFLGQLYGGIWRSTNRGSTWQRMGFENPDLHVLSITIDANDNVFAGMGFAWVRRSSDNGATWSEVSTGLVGTYVLSVIAIPGGPLFAGTSPFTEGGVFRSIDGGSTWLPTGFTPPTKYADFGFFAFNSQRRVIVSTNVYGLFQTDSNGSWAQGRLTIGSINSLVPNSRGDLFAHTSFGIHRSSNLGNSWDIVRGATTGSYTTALAVGETDHMYASSFQFIIRSTDRGQTWDNSFSLGSYSLTGPGLAATPNGLVIGTICIIPPGTGTNGLARSTNNGFTWDYVPNGFVPELIFPSPNGTVYAVRSGSLFRSTDLGTSWLSINNGLPSSVRHVSFPSSVRVLAGTQIGVYLSVDSGNNWAPAGLGSTDVRSTVVNAEGHMFAGTDRGVFQSVDTTMQWVPMNIGLTDSSITSLAITHDGYLFGGSSGGGLFRTTQPTVDVRETDGASVSDFQVSQNYPNPFNPSTRIRFQLPTTGKVRIAIFDLLGKELGIIVEENRPAGTNEVDFVSHNLASGVYYYQIRFGNHVETKKMILLR